VKDLAQAEDVLGAAKDGSVKVFIMKVFIISSSSTSTSSEPTSNTRPNAVLWRLLKDKHVKDVAQEVAQDVAQDLAQDLAFGGPGGARPPRHAITTAGAHDMGAQLGSSVAFWLGLLKGASGGCCEGPRSCGANVPSPGPSNHLASTRQEVGTPMTDEPGGEFTFLLRRRSYLELHLTRMSRSDPRSTRHAMFATLSTSLQREHVFDDLCGLESRSLVPRTSLLCSKKVGWREGTLRITTHQCTERRIITGTAISPFHVCALENLAHCGHEPCPCSAKQTPISSRGWRISRLHHVPPASK